MNRNYIPEIKICGITRLADARAARDAGADYLGFVLYDKSPRAISPDALRRIRGALGKNVKCVGVFVNPPPLAAAQQAKDCGLDVVQLCGEEKYESFRLFPLPVWRVIRMQNGEVTPAPSAWPAERYVLDSNQAGLYGGTGAALDWSAAARIAGENKIMLAGGLTPANVATAIRIVRPFGVDVSSGVELRPGQKDHEKIRFFIEVVKTTCHDV
ncbi:MAG: phosphoribosylanthranilate isomerase [Kiritimatiellae bacterium]|nr:phosphoribosylanthranilate isomerase [Kiritimatiellia bacterium]